MSANYVIQLCMPDPAVCRSQQLIEAQLQRLTHDGFRVALLNNDPEYALWHSSLYNQTDERYRALSAARKAELQQPGLTELLQAAVRDFVTYRSDVFTIHALGVSNAVQGFTFHMTILLHDNLDDDEELRASVDEHLVDGLAAGGYWQQLPDLLYNVWHPDFAYSYPTTGRYFSPQQLRAGKLPYLYTDNYFGPTLVVKLGRERLLTTPGATIRELGDGGLFVAIKQDITAASQHLGLVAQVDVR